MINLYQAPAGPFTATVTSAAQYFALSGVGLGSTGHYDAPPAPVTVSVETNSNVLNTLTLEGRINEDDPWIEMVSIGVTTLSNFRTAFQVHPLPYMRAGWSNHAAGSSSGVVVRVRTPLREQRP